MNIRRKTIKVDKKKFVYLFSEGNGSMRELLGGKGANLALRPMRPLPEGPAGHPPGRGRGGGPGAQECGRGGPPPGPSRLPARRAEV